MGATELEELLMIREELAAAVSDLTTLAHDLDPCVICALYGCCNEHDMEQCANGGMFVWRGPMGVE